jgi:dTDP-4-amino-4,6-dideoxygalactose transaminase
MEKNIDARAAVWSRYEQALGQTFQLQLKPEGLDYNYAYFPVVFESEDQAVCALEKLKNNGVLARRYFYPSLESIACLGSEVDQPISKDIACRVLCLPIYSDLSPSQQSCILRSLKM